jgi:hypothetical protein
MDRKSRDSGMFRPDTPTRPEGEFTEAVEAGGRVPNESGFVGRGPVDGVSFVSGQNDAEIAALYGEELSDEHAQETSDQ